LARFVRFNKKALKINQIKYNFFVADVRAFKKVRLEIIRLDQNKLNHNRLLL